MLWEVIGGPQLACFTGTGKSGVPYKEGLIDIEAGTSDKRGIVSERVCFRSGPELSHSKDQSSVCAASTFTESES